MTTAPVRALDVLCEIYSIATTLDFASMVILG